MCDHPAVTAIEAGDKPLCGYHYVLQEDEACLKAHLQADIQEFGTIMEHPDIQAWIRRLRPQLYQQLRDYFSQP